LNDRVNTAPEKYEFEDAPAGTFDSGSTPIAQDSRNPETPRYAPSHDATRVDSSQTTFGTSPDYTFERTTAAFGAIDLNKGKEREAGNFIYRIRTFNMSQLIIPR
jgi:hypothetical protein